MAILTGGRSLAQPGTRFGRLVVLGERFTYRAYKRREPFVVVQCDCGTVFVSRCGLLVKGETRSCGCLRKEVTRATHLTHGMSHTREFHAYIGMLERCRNPKHQDYYLYGGRGVRVCDRWTGPGGFIRFEEDMGRHPGNGLTLDRIDPNGDYCKENCRWATHKEQRANQRPKAQGRRDLRGRGSEGDDGRRASDRHCVCGPEQVDRGSSVPAVPAGVIAAVC